MNKHTPHDHYPSATAEKKQESRRPELENVQKVMDLYIDGIWNGNVASLREAVRLAYDNKKTG